MATEFQIKRENYTLAGYKWSAAVPKALVVLIHGLGEEASKYDTVALRLNEAGYSVYAIDLPGHGKSEGKRGHVGCSYEIVKIVDAVIIYAKKDCPDVPVFVMGHSMGGNIALSYRYYRRDIPDISGYVASAPWLMIGSEKLVKKYKLAVFASLLLPKVTVRGIGCPITLQTAVDRERDARLVTAKAEEGMPVYLFSANGDPICLAEGARLFRDRAGGGCTYREWEASEHELLMSQHGEEVILSVIDWLDGMLRK